MGQIETLTAWHKKQIGTKENPAGSNSVRYNDIYWGWHAYGDSYPWCMAYQWCGFHECGLEHLITRTAGCTTLMNWAKGKGLFVRGNYKEGDLILFQFDSDPTDADHVGYCLRQEGNTVYCIEGNTSRTSADNGGCVMYTERNTSCILGAVRPPYDGQPVKPTGNEIYRIGDMGAEVKAIQQKLIELGYSCGSYGADGDFGTATRNAVISFQRDHGLSADGEVGPLTKAALDKAKKFAFSAWTDKMILRKGSTGAAVKELQTALIKLNYSCGICGADGDFGTATRNAVISFQRAKGLDQDGEAGPLTRAALEKAL